jgi:hypothetical protein
MEDEKPQGNAALTGKSVAAFQGTGFVPQPVKLLLVLRRQFGRVADQQGIFRVALVSAGGFVERASFYFGMLSPLI